MIISCAYVFVRYYDLKRMPSYTDRILFKSMTGIREVRQDKFNVFQISTAGFTSYHITLKFSLVDIIIVPC